MANTIFIKMLDKNIQLELRSNMLTDISIRKHFHLPPDASFFLSHVVNGQEMRCEARSLPEPCFLLPKQWSGMQFFVESYQMPPRSARLMNISHSSAPLHIPIEIDDRVHKLAQYLFCEKSDTKACFTVISTHHAASFYHGPHKHWDPKSTGNHTMTICNQAGQEFQTKIVACNPEVDFVIVSSDVPFVTVAPRLCLPNKSERYILLGYPKPNTGYEALEGIITSVLLDDEGRLRGSRGSQRGYNGGPMFNYKGELLGINVADKSSQQCIGLSNRSTLEKPFSEINDAFPSLSVMVPSCILASSSF